LISTSGLDIAVRQEPVQEIHREVRSDEQSNAVGFPARY
jgi:hypothetical protein